MEVTINTLVKEREIIPLRGGQVRMTLDKELVVLVTRDRNQRFGFTYLKGDMRDCYKTTHDLATQPSVEKNLNDFYVNCFPIVADKVSIQINVN